MGKQVASRLQNDTHVVSLGSTLEDWVAVLGLDDGFIVTAFKTFYSNTI